MTKKEIKEAKEIISLIQKDQYNTCRPSAVIIPELLLVIKLLVWQLSTK